MALRGRISHPGVMEVLLMVVVRMHLDMGRRKSSREARKVSLGPLGIAIKVAGSGLELGWIGIH